MNQQTLQKLVDDVGIQCEIADNTDALKELSPDLVEEAERDPEAQVTIQRVGRPWTEEGSDGCLCRVGFRAHSLMPELEGKSNEAQERQAIAEVFGKLCTTVKNYQFASYCLTQPKSLLPVNSVSQLEARMVGSTAVRIVYVSQGEPIMTNLLGCLTDRRNAFCQRDQRSPKQPASLREFPRITLGTSTHYTCGLAAEDVITPYGMRASAGRRCPTNSVEPRPPVTAVTQSDQNAALRDS